MKPKLTFIDRLAAAMQQQKNYNNNNKTWAKWSGKRLRNLRLFSLQVAKDVVHFAVNVRHFAFNSSLRLAQP